MIDTITPLDKAEAKMKLKGKVALVTGAGRGIGRAIALKLAGEGASIVINDLDDGPAEETAEAVRAAGSQCVVVAGSVTTPEISRQLVSVAVDQFGGLDIIVNNAGYTWDNVIQKMSDEQWYAMLDVHMTAPFRLLQAAHPVIREFSRREAERGERVVRKVVNISSIAGIFGNAGQVGYGAAKAGIIGLTKALSKEWGRLNVAVNCVAFGLVNTRLTATPVDGGSTANIAGNEIKLGVNPDLLTAMERMIPLGRGGTPEEAAGAVFLFCIPESDYVSGEVLLCAGGLGGL